MKKLILCFFWLAFVGVALAQDREALAQQATEEQAGLFQLSSQQVEEMYEIQERRFRNLESIEPLRSQDMPLYLQKKNSIREMTQASIQRMLNEQQLLVFRNQTVERRKRESALIQRMKEEGAGREEIQYAIWDME